MFEDILSINCKMSLTKGLPNLGNTCYLNAALQTIFQIFGDSFISGEYYTKLKSDSVINTFMNDFAHLVAAIQNTDNRWSKLHVNLYLRNVTNYLSKIDEFKRFVGFKQADSYEFLVELLNLLSKYLTYDVLIEISIKVQENELNNYDKTKLVFFKFLKKNMKNTSIIDEKLKGYFRASITCAHDNCKNSSEKFEEFLALSLPIKDNNTLEECLENYVKPITLDENNQWYCDKCKRKSKAIKKMTICSTAEYLIISYKRYMNCLTTTIKDNRNIITPLEKLDMSPYVENISKEETMYNLCSMTVHKGSLSNGHYVAARKINDSWKVFNDSSVIPVLDKQINPSSAYYLVYKRI